MVLHGSHQYTPFMLVYIPAPWIRHGLLIDNNRCMYIRFIDYYYLYIYIYLYYLLFWRCPNLWCHSLVFRWDFFGSIDQPWAEPRLETPWAAAAVAAVAAALPAMDSFSNGISAPSKVCRKSCGPIMDLFVGGIPSGYGWHNYGKSPLIVSFPMKNGDFP